VSRLKTKVAQKEAEDIEAKSVQFFTFLNKTLQANPGIPANLMINMDETPVYLDMVGNNTMSQKGVKEVQIMTTGSDKQRVTVALTVASSGFKFPPMIIFKGSNSKNGRILQEFNERER